MFSQRELTDEQRAIIAWPLDTDLYVEAPAGHGKTSTAMLTAGRIAARFKDDGRQTVLVLTFSKMAVRQIDAEKQQHVPRSLQGRIVIRTYHSFYYDLIRTYARYLGFQHGDFGHITEREREALYRTFCTRYSVVGMGYADFSYSQYSAANIPAPEPVRMADKEVTARAADFLSEYHNTEHRLGFQDFPFYAYRVVANSSFVRRLLSYKYPVVFLDEFQNTNEVQWLILRLCVRDSKLVVFADPKQTIHGFRGAGGMVERLKATRHSREMPLTENFRNSGSLYAFASAIASGTNVVVCPPNVTFHPLALYRRDKWCLKWDIRKAMQVGCRSVAVLAKENKTVAEVSSWLGQKTPRTPAIHCEAVSDDYSGYDEENVVLSLLQLVCTCEPSDLRVLGAVLGSCRRGDAEYGVYFQQAMRAGACEPGCIKPQDGVPGSKNARHVLSALSPLIVRGRVTEADDAWARVREALSGFRAIPTLPDLSVAYARLREEWDLLRDRTGPVSVEKFTAHLRTQRRRENFLESRTYARGVFIMTLHQSQGKEFDAVFIWQCNDRIIPHPQEIGSGDFTPSRNLLYVGITRARRLVRIYYEHNERARPSRLIQPFLSV